MYSCPAQRFFYLALLLSPAYGLAIQALSSAVASTQPSIPGNLGVGDFSIPGAPSPTIQEHIRWEPTDPELVPSTPPATTNPPPQPPTHDSLKPRHPPIPLLTPRDSDNNDNNAPLGVKIGLGVGIPFAVVFFSYFCLKCHCRPAQRPAKNDGKRTAGRRLALPISNSRRAAPAVYPLAPLHPSSVPAAVHFGPPPMVPPPAYGEEGGGGVYHPQEGEVGYYPPPAAPAPPPPERVRTPPPVYRPSVEAGRSPPEGGGMDGLEVVDLGVGRGEGR